MRDERNEVLQSLFRAIPSVDETKQALFLLDPALQSLPKDLLRAKIRAYWEEKRQEVRAGRLSSVEDCALSLHLPHLHALLVASVGPKLKRVLNATGVVVHTNLGRSELCKEAQVAVALAARNYTSLEMDLTTGARGSRYALVEELLCTLTGAEAAMVVNNNAAAVLLMLDTLCREGEVIVSRGELVEIGGSFRIPEVMARSGARLREVGATNRTHLYDFEGAITPETRALMHVHTSNFRVLGFHSRVPLSELATLAHSRDLLLLEDLGSGSLLHLSVPGLPDEPTVQDSIQEGVDVVTFSGDKVLGGPQAGILVGRRSLIERCKKNQLTRALRADKLCLSGLEATLRVYLDPERARREIPTVRRIVLDETTLFALAKRLSEALNKVLGPKWSTVEHGGSRVGGGAFPEYELKTFLVRLAVRGGASAQALKRELLAGDPPLICRLEHDALFLDPRTLEEEDYPLLVRVVRQALERIERNASVECAASAGDA